MDRIQILAARELDDSGPKGVAKLTKVSAAAADSLILGSKSVTDKVLTSVARASQVSGHWLLTGEGSMSPLPSQPDEEALFIKSMRKLNEGGALLMLFAMDLGAVLDALPREEWLRVLSAVHRLIDDVPARQSLSNFLGEGFVSEIRRNVSQELFRRGISTEQLSEQRGLLTPMHEILGVFGPDQGGSLISMLAE